MRRTLLETVVILAILCFTAMSGYELTAKSPRLLGQALPGWVNTVRVEHLISWQQPTRIYPLDKVLHEGREAWLYYGMVVGLANRNRISSQPAMFKTADAAPPCVAIPDPAPRPDRPRSARRG